MSYDSLVNRGEYLSAHYLAEVLPKDLKKKDGLPARWTDQEKAAEKTPRTGLRALRKPYFAERKALSDFIENFSEAADETESDESRTYVKTLHELHSEVLRALGFDAIPRELEVVRADMAYAVQVAHAEPTVIAVECGWAADVDAALDAAQAGLLLDPVALDNREELPTGTKLASWLFAADEPPRYVLILAGGVVILADRATWGEGRYLAVSLDVALDRNDAKELETIAALFSADALLPPEEGGSEPLAELIAGSRRHAVGVSTELREGLRQSVEIIANEVLARIDEAGVRPADIMEPSALAKELGRESLRYLYRILFLLYAEARPELGVLPSDHPEYAQGYGLQRLGELVVRDLIGEDAQAGFHLSESLDLLFRMVNNGYRSRGASAETPADEPEGSEGEGIRFEPLRADLFAPERTQLIGRDALVRPGYDEDDPDAPRIDTRLRNSALYKVLRLLMLTKGKKKERGGFISYAQLGINQLGAVYEGLMSYTGFIAEEELYEVAKGGDSSGGSWMIPASKAPSYPDDVFVRHVDEDGRKTEDRIRYRPGAFVYRLAGRDRQTSASYYTPESLTQVTVQLALQHRLDQDGTTTSAREILDWTICEPALGSGAFLNEAINQVAAEYLKRRQKELGVSLEPEQHASELQKVKAYIALHNSYGVDLNETAVELAEVSVWLNVMHPGLQAPWFGLHLRRGNSLIGAGRRLYRPDRLKKGEWLTTAPDDHPFVKGPIPEGYVQHFLLPAHGWGAVAGEKEAKELAPEDAKRLGHWRKQMRKSPSAGKKRSQTQRLQALSRRAEFLWGLVQQRLEISEREIRREIKVWEADWIEHPEQVVPKEKVYEDLVTAGTPYWRLKTVMDAWSALWFWPLDKVGLLDGSAPLYSRLRETAIDESPPGVVEAAPVVAAREPIGMPVTYEIESLFGDTPKQLPLTGSLQPSRPKPATKSRIADSVRPVIPLANLDDWLDFTEALLGRADVPDDSLVSHFRSLDELEEYEDEIPKWTGMDSPSKLSDRFPCLDTIEEIADQQGFFHWELQFTQVFANGGFDLQTGNPPWVRPRWQEDTVLAELEPWFMLADKPGVHEWRSRKDTVLPAGTARDYFLAELAANTGTVEFLGSAATYPLLVGTQPDLYRAFMSRAWANLGSSGSAGLIHPDTHFGGAKEGALRAATYRHLRMHVHFSNRYELFEIEGTRQFGVNIYGRPGRIEFTHASWLFHPAVLLGSLDHDGSGELPGIKHEGKWELRPHRERLIRVDEVLLSQWRRLSNAADVPVDRTPLLYPVTTAEAGAIEALAGYERRLGSNNPRISRGYDEANAKKDGLIRWHTGAHGSLGAAILQGPHFTQATPFGKQPNIPCKTNRDWSAWDLTRLEADAIPVTNYVRASDEETYLAAQDSWTHRELLEQHRNSGTLTEFSTRRYTEFYRLAWRVMIPFDTERSLFTALVPPGPAHVDAVHTLALHDNRGTALAAGFWATLPLDYILRITGRSHLRNAEANKMPAAEPDHPLAPELLLRTLRLNCLTEAYAPLWAELFDPAWIDLGWAVEWPGLVPLAAPASVAPEWAAVTPLRTERERRAALVELDALVAVWLGVSAEELVTIYRSRYPILSDYEAQIWFDVNGRKVAANHNTYGHGQTKEHYLQLMAHLADPEKVALPDGYEEPFYKADREGEYRQAHAVFSERLHQAGGWPANEDRAEPRVDDSGQGSAV
jgi:hypothetical protein